MMQAGTYCIRVIGVPKIGFPPPLQVDTDRLYLVDEMDDSRIIRTYFSTTSGFRFVSFVSYEQV